MVFIFMNCCIQNVKIISIFRVHFCKEVFKKLGANVIYVEAFNDCWETVVPGNEQHFAEASQRLNNYLSYRWWGARVNSL